MLVGGEENMNSSSLDVEMEEANRKKSDPVDVLDHKNQLALVPHVGNPVSPPPKRDQKRSRTDGKESKGSSSSVTKPNLAGSQEERRQSQ